MQIKKVSKVLKAFLVVKFETVENCILAQCSWFWLGMKGQSLIVLMWLDDGREEYSIAIELRILILWLQGQYQALC